MKIVFEHQGRKTTIIGNDYVTIVDKIRSIFPDQNHRRIQFYDPELTDYFEFTSLEQVIDQPNGLKMSFDMSDTLDSVIPDPASSSTINVNENASTNKNITPTTSTKRSRKKSSLEHENKNDEPLVLPTYCDLITQGLQSRDSFPAIQKPFLEQTCTHFLQQYPDCSLKNVHHSFILALTQKFPALNYLNLNVDGKNGKAPHHTISNLLSRKKRNMKYSKTHPTPKRPRLPTINSNSDGKTSESVVVEETTDKDDIHNPVIDDGKKSQCSFQDLQELLDETSGIEAFALQPDANDQSTVTAAPTKTPIRPQTISKTDRTATISLIPPTTPSIVNTSSISTPSIINTSYVSTPPVMIKPVATTNAVSTLIYHDGRMHITPVSSQSVVAVHKAIIPRDTAKKGANNENNNCTGLATSTIKDSEKILQPSTIDNIQQSNSLKNDLEVWFPKLSKSEQTAYNKDVSRLRSIVKPKTRSTNHISIGEIHALIRNTHTIRRRMLSEKQDIDFTVKLVIEYMLLKNRLCTFDEVQDQARLLLDDLIEKYSVKQQKQSEADFLSMNMLCEDAGEHNLFFKNGLTDPHPVMGIVIMPSTAKEFEKAFMFIRYLPYKMPVSIGGGGLQKILALLLVIYINLNVSPGHKLLRLLSEQCNKKQVL
ncbi:unnamed protein product [Rotaria sordida]|uniref:Uncharacterized protein n=1 Tax=Rotaria sordida TaxID=392033 RepID=A0A819GQX4_9BILA|nr:unnamed protein product [Rotaria sordida]